MTREQLEQELQRAYAEIRKQVASSGAVFDRDVCRRADAAEHDNSTGNWWGFNPHG